MNASRLSVSLLFFTAVPVFAGTLRETYRVSDRGHPRDFVVARNEVQARQAPVRVTARATAEDMRAVARAVGGDLVLYEKGLPHSVQTRRFLTKRVAIQVAPGTDANGVARAAGGEGAVAAPGGKGDWFIVQTPAEPGSALDVADRLRNQAGVTTVEPLLARQQTKRFIPNDPFFSNQWHLQNTGGSGGLAGIDVDIVSVWNTYKGDGINIGIVDDGLEDNHPDLKDNYNASLSYDFNYGDSDPMPAAYNGDDHGTACAGLAAAKGNNGIGVCGAAFNAGLAGIRLIALPDTDEQEAEAFALHDDVIQVKSNSWGPADDGRTLEGPGPLAKAALEDAVQTGRGGKGTIFVWAGGNGKQFGDASTFDGYAGSRQVIAVGALTNQGKQAFYSEPGCNLICTAPSSGGTLGIATVDRQGDDGYNFHGEPGELSDTNYTKEFGGTSAASPLVAGCIGLLLEANPNLGWRDVQEILISTARKVDDTDKGWSTNGGGFHFNDKYGAGLIDTQAAVNLATTWTNLGPELSLAEEMTNMATPIPDNKAAGVQHSFTFSDPNFRIEHVEVTVDITHASRGQLQISLKSPSGTISNLAPLRPRDKGANFEHWVFTTTHHWGEAATGVWTVQVADRVAGTAGMLNGVKVEFFGAAQQVHADSAGYTVVADGNSNGVVDPNELVTLNFALKNDGVTTATNVTASLVASSSVVNPSSQQSYGTLNSGDSVSRPFTFTATGNLGDTIQATLNVSYQQGVSTVNTSVVFPITLGTIDTMTYSSYPNTISVAIPSLSSFSGSGNAGPYPSTIAVSGLPPQAVVTDVVLHLDHLEHSRSSDLAFLLVGPGGKRMIPMADVGGYDAPDVNLVISNSAEVALPSTSPLFSGTFFPAAHWASVHVFPAPAPARPYGSDFSVFKGINPNGNWQLFIRDNRAKNFGGLNSWSLDIHYAH